MFFLARSSDDSAQLFCTMMLMGAIGVVKGFRAFQHRRKAEDTACSLITSAPQGFVEVQGQAWPTANLLGLDGRPVCYWSFVVAEKHGSGKNSRWVEVYSSISTNDILVTDKSGTCRVAVDDAELEMPSRVYTLKELTAENRRVIEARAVGAVRYLQGGLLDKPIRITEVKLLAGAPVYVRGEFSTSLVYTHAVAVGDHASFKDQLPKFNSPGYQASMFDRNKDGHISEDEYKDGFAAAASASVRKIKTQSVPIAGYFNTTSNHKLFIADVYQRHLLERLNYHTVLYLWGGLALFSLGCGLLLKRLGVV